MKEELTLLKLIRKSQYGLSEPISFDGIDMSKVYNEALNHSVLSIIAPEVLSASKDDRWSQSQHKQKARFILYCYAQDELRKILDQASIPFVIIKGNASAINYSNPSLRTMGDIDFIIEPNDLERTKAVLMNSGYCFDHSNNRHISYIKQGFVFELHYRYSHEIDIEEYIKLGINNRVVSSICGYQFPMLPELPNGLVLLDHLRSHLKSGVGLRHVIDWMMYVNKYLDDDFWYSSFQQIVKDKGMDIFAINITRMCQLYLGLPNSITWCRNANDKLCEQLLECILLSGNFGKKNGNGQPIETVFTSFRRQGFFYTLQESGKSNWKAYHKHPYLKPFCWLYQLIRYAFNGIKSKRKYNQLKDDFDRSQMRYNILKQLHIS